MRLRQTLHRKGKKGPYMKWVVVLPLHVVEELGWAVGEELLANAVGRTLVLRAAGETESWADQNPSARVAAVQVRAERRGVKP